MFNTVVVQAQNPQKILHLVVCTTKCYMIVKNMEFGCAFCIVCRREWYVHVPQNIVQKTVAGNDVDREYYNRDSVLPTNIPPNSIRGTHATEHKS